jgi:type I restriction-modification system DNA methylase subunit
MPVNYTCDKCNKSFDQKNDYNRHINKKYSCVLNEQQDKITEDDSLKQLDSFFSKIRDLLRDNENITGDKALDVITDFLFLRLLNYETKKKDGINLLTKIYNEKIKVDGEEYDIDEHKKYFKWDELMKLIENIDKDSKDYKSKDLLTNVIQHVIFGGMLKLNENTMSIYRNRRFYVKKMVTIIKLLKEYNKIEFDKLDVDVKGRAYELTLQKEGATNKDFSQFFTPRWIDKYMVAHADITVNEDGSYTKILDPACGTAGILSEYLSHIKKIADEKDILLDNNVSEYIYGNEIVDDTLKIAQMNILLKSGKFNTNMKNKDFLESECFNFKEKKFDGNIIMNPPFALTKNYKLSNDESKDVFHTKTKSGTMLFLMSALYSIQEGKQLIMVSPNGKEIFNKNKEYVNIRKNVVENNNLYKIAILPDGSFKPYTGVQTIVLMVRKGGKTKEIEYVKVNKNKDNTYSETSICKVKYDKLMKSNYSWNYKDYLLTNQVKYDGIVYKNISEIVEYLPKSKRLASYGNSKGKYNFYTSSKDLKKYCDECDYKDECIIIGTGGNANIKISSNFSCSTDNIILKTNEEVNNKYLYYYLSVNIDILENLFHGNTIKHLSKSDLDQIKIPIPSIEEQEEIVKQMEKKDKLIESLKEQIKQLNKSVKDSFDNYLQKCNDVKPEEDSDEIIEKHVELDEEPKKKIIKKKTGEPEEVLPKEKPIKKVKTKTVFAKPKK